MIVVLQAMWIFILVMPVLTEMAGTGNILEEFYKLKYCSTVVYMVPRA